MPRYSRIFLTGYPHHIVQRGHDRKPVFANDGDYRYYLDNLGEQLETRHVALHAYCLMTNHVHLLLEPLEDAKALSGLMRVVAARQTRYVNSLECRTGTLWEGRFRCSLVDRQDYLLACIRYIEMNPVKARIVENPFDYPWSSCRARCGSANQNPDIVELAAAEQRALETEYRRVSTHRGQSEWNHQSDALIANAVARNQLTGSHRFRGEIERKLGRRIGHLAPGRPTMIRDK